MDKPSRLDRLDLSIKQQIISLNKRILTLCHDSTSFSNQEQLQKAQSLLQSAKHHLQNIKNISFKTQLQSSLLISEALIFHNFSRQQQALSIINQAILLEKDNTQNLAKIYLNKSSILNDCKRYEQALLIAKKANQLLSGKKLKSPNRFERQNVRELYAMSFLTIGVQYEKMERIEDAIDVYQKGVQACRLWLGENNKLTQTMISNLNSLKRKSLEKRMRVNKLDRTTDRVSIRTNTQNSVSITKQKNFRIKQVVTTSKNEEKSRMRGNSIRDSRAQESLSAYNPKLRAIDLKVKTRLVTNVDEMRDIEKIKGLYQSRKEKKVIRHKTESKVDKKEDNQWDAFISNQIFA